MTSSKTFTHKIRTTLLESVGVNNVLGVAINTVVGKRHLVADVAKILAQTYEVRATFVVLLFVVTSPHGNSSGTVWE
jgi:hypothetical protein